MTVHSRQTLSPQTKGPRHSKKNQIDQRSDITNRRSPALHKRLASINKTEAKAKRRGAYSEKIALEVLQELIAAKQLPAAATPPKIYKTNSWKDRCGYDISYKTDRGSLDFQVKSSLMARRKFLGKHPNIPCFVVASNPADTELLATQFKLAFWKEYDKLLTA
jgi:hypothetical protein